LRLVTRFSPHPKVRPVVSGEVEMCGLALALVRDLREHKMPANQVNPRSCPRKQHSVPANLTTLQRCQALEP
jgi:hypothetical protein